MLFNQMNLSIVEYYSLDCGDESRKYRKFMIQGYHHDECIVF